MPRRFGNGRLLKRFLFGAKGLHCIACMTRCLHDAAEGILASFFQVVHLIYTTTPEGRATLETSSEGLVSPPFQQDSRSIATVTFRAPSTRPTSLTGRATQTRHLATGRRPKRTLPQSVCRAASPMCHVPFRRSPSYSSSEHAMALCSGRSCTCNESKAGHSKPSAPKAASILDPMAECG